MRKQLAVMTALAGLAAFGGAARAEPGARAPEVPLLELHALYVQRGGSLVFSPRLEALRGERVRVRGYMVQMEEAPRGAFYLAARPIEQDESGAGTGDIPVDSVLVKVAGAATAEIPWRPCPSRWSGRWRSDARRTRADGSRPCA